jgi:hypothetical protein
MKVFAGPPAGACNRDYESHILRASLCVRMSGSEYLQPALPPFEGSVLVRLSPASGTCLRVHLSVHSEAQDILAEHDHHSDVTLRCVVHVKVL